MALTKAEKKEHVTTHLKKLRKDLRIMHACVTEQQTLPNPEEVKVVMKEMEALLEVLEPSTSRKKKS